MNPQSIIDDIIRREGNAYINHPADRGGASKFGITQSTLSTSRGYQVTPGDVAALTETEARDIYLHNYIIAPGFNRIADENLCALAVDCAVNHGPGRAIRWLQEIVGTTVDGILGNHTEEAINTRNPKDIYRKLLARRVRFYGEILNRDHTQVVFAAGWLNRAMEFMDYV